MATDSDYERLMAKARNCRNNAKAEQVVVDAFHDEYVAGLSGGIKEAGLEGEAATHAHRHMRETYDFYIGGQRRARDFLADAALFERAALAVGAA